MASYLLTKICFEVILANRQLHSQLPLSVDLSSAYDTAGISSNSLPADLQSVAYFQTGSLAASYTHQAK